MRATWSPRSFLADYTRLGGAAAVEDREAMAPSTWGIITKNMATKTFSLVARVSTDDPATIEPVLRRMITQGRVEKTASHEFLLEADFTGGSARELNRSLLSELRRAVKKTRLRAEWTSGKTTEKFFDYVPKGKTRATG